MDRMEREMDGLQREFKSVSASYADTVLNLVVGSGYLSSLIGNPRLSGYLERHHPEILTEFRAIVAATSLEESDSGDRKSPPSWVEVARSTAPTRAPRPQYQ